MKKLTPAALIFLIVFLSWMGVAKAEDAAPKDRFFLMGSGALHLHNLRNGEKANVKLLSTGGQIDEAALNTVDRVFGYPTAAMMGHISPRLLFMLSYFADLAAPGKTIHIESGYRSPQYNDQIRAKGANAARTSTHMDGMALDFWIDGISGRKLWETVRAMNCCGVGYYGGKTIHLDAGRPRFWEAATSGTRSTEPDYNRHIYLSPQYDRYAPSENLKLSLSGISTFGFGVHRTAELIAEDNPGGPAAPLQLEGNEAAPCVVVGDHATAHSLSARLPQGLIPGRYRIQLAICRKPFPQMMDLIGSRDIEITR